VAPDTATVLLPGTGKPALAAGTVGGTLLGKPAVAPLGKAAVAPTGGAALSDFDARPLAQSVTATAVTTSRRPPMPRATMDGKRLGGLALGIGSAARGTATRRRRTVEACAEAESGWGTVMLEPHFGHFVFLPAASSSTWKRFWHWGQAKRIMAFLLGDTSPPSRSEPPLSH
jgi:hypothetical protein